MGKILDVMTIDAGPFKTLIEGLKDVLTDTNIEFIKSDFDTSNTETTEQENCEKQKPHADDEVSGKKQKKKKKSKNVDSDDEASTKKKKKKNQSDSDDEQCTKKQKKEEKDDKDDKNKTQLIQQDKDTDNGGIRILTMDNTNSLIINVKLKAKSFNKFECKKKSFVIAINLPQLYKIIRNIDKDNMLNLYVNDDDQQTLYIKIISTDKKKESISKLKLLDIDNKSIDIPPISCECAIKFSTAEFHRICREMSSMADYLEIKVSKNFVTYSCKGDSVEQTKTYSLDEANNTSIVFSKNSPEIVQGIFELKYLTLFSKYSNLCTHIWLYMKNDWLLCINYTVATLGNMYMCLTPVPNDGVKQNFDDDNYDDFEVDYKD